jgi:hypothetical protein
MHIRTAVSASSTILILTTSSGGLQIDASAGTVLILATPAQTAAIGAGKYVYDLELEETATGVVTRILQGNLTVRAEVTK